MEATESKAFVRSRVVLSRARDISRLPVLSFFPSAPPFTLLIGSNETPPRISPQWQTSPKQLKQLYFSGYAQGLSAARITACNSGIDSEEAIRRATDSLKRQDYFRAAQSCMGSLWQDVRNPAAIQVTVLFGGEGRKSMLSTGRDSPGTSKPRRCVPLQQPKRRVRNSTPRMRSIVRQFSTQGGKAKACQHWQDMSK